MEEPKDKRTKAYKEWKKHQKNLQKSIDKKEAYIDKGLGDKVEEFTEKTGIKKAVKKLVGDDCGCDERKKKLNKIRTRFPIVRCFTEEQYNKWTEFVNKEKRNEVTYKEQTDIIIPIYAQLFARSLKPMSCCIDQYINDIQRVYENY